DAHATSTPSGIRRDSSGPRPQIPRGTGIRGVNTRSRFSSDPGFNAGPRTTTATTRPIAQGVRAVRVGKFRPIQRDNPPAGRRVKTLFACTNNQPIHALAL